MVVIVGSGAGGGLLAMELATNGIPVTILEKGPYDDSKNAFNYYDASDEGVDLLKTTCVGGSTIVSMANAVRALEEELKEYGIEISSEFDYVEELINVHQMDDSHIGRGTQLFLDASEKLGLNPIKMQKAVEEEKCIQCGRCALGCPKDAKWSSKDFIDKAVDAGAELIVNAEVTKVSTENSKAKAVEYVKNGETYTLEDDIIVLSAGAVSSAMILRNTGLSAGNKIFFDPFVTVGGVIKNIGFNSEVQMNALVEGKNFILSPHFSSFIREKIDDDSIDDNDILSIMVKTPDECQGYIDSEGKVVKINTINDIRYLAEGTAVAGFILKEAGVDPKTIASTVYRGAHPGGTAAIGEVVDKNLKTDIDGLYVCDASVIPQSPGKPPILTILALSKRLADYLKGEM